MKPLNQSERKKAFGNFLLFFIITIAVIITAVFFSIRVPFKQNEYLLQQMDLAGNERAFAESFKNKMQETMNWLDSVNLKPNADMIDSRISNNITRMTQMAESDSTMNSFYLGIVQTLNNLQQAKFALRTQLAKNENAGSGEDLKDKQIKFLKDQLELCNAALKR